MTEMRRMKKSRGLIVNAPGFVKSFAIFEISIEGSRICISNGRMANELIVNITPTETRIARLEAGQISELIVERVQDAGLVGNIYKGRIVRVLPGMQAAFAEIGLERTAFLYVSDIAPELALEEMMAGEEESPPPDRPRFENRARRQLPQIQDLVREGQDVVVQIAREPIGTKGARLT